MKKIVVDEAVSDELEDLSTGQSNEIVTGNLSEILTKIVAV